MQKIDGTDHGPSEGREGSAKMATRISLVAILCILEDCLSEFGRTKDPAEL